jgi:hypothetical protein
MFLIKGAFVGEKNFDVIKMHGTTITIIRIRSLSLHALNDQRPLVS